MAKGQFDNFEINGYGNVKLWEYTGMGRLEHEYNCVPRDVIKWLLNSSKQPSIKDFEDKVSAARDKKNNGRGEEVGICTGCSYWSD